jgi:phage terminase large subunit-like protein
MQSKDLQGNLNPDLAALRYLKWHHQNKGLARTNQLAPEGNWSVWLILAGRGFGKTRSGAEWLAGKAIKNPGVRCAIIARTAADVRTVCLEGVSGILAILREYDAIAEYNKSLGVIKLKNGSIIYTYSAEEPDRLRGPQHHYVWCDELAAWQYSDTWAQMQFGLRLGTHPQVVVTTTPRPTPLIKDLLKRDTTIVTRGSTFENAENLSKSALLELQLRYAGTRLGQQELYGLVLDDNPGALWSFQMLERTRISKYDLPPLVRVVVGVDPAVTSGEESDMTGIVVAGMSADSQYYVLADNTIKASPQIWGEKVISSFEEYKADRIIAETNNGGDLVIHLLRTIQPNVPVKKVTATRGKAIRAEPIAALFEQGRAHLVGYFHELEDELREFEPGVNMPSPDRLDAMVWALTELSEGSNTLAHLAQLAQFCTKCGLPAPKNATRCPVCQTLLGEVNANA